MKGFTNQVAEYIKAQFVQPAIRFTVGMYMKEFFIAAFAVFSVGKVTFCLPTANGGQGDVYGLKVVEDVWVEGSGNYNSYQWLLVGTHAGYPKKRSLIRFEDIPDDCKTVNFAVMYIYYSYSHKASWQTITQAPFISRTIQAHRVMKYWNETQATRYIRKASKKWKRPYLGLDDTDANDCPAGQATIYTYRPSGFVEIEVTSATRDWKAGKPNYGLLLWATNEDTNGRDSRFYSKTYSDSSKHPYMLLNCN